MKFDWRNIAAGLFIAAALTACGGGSDNNIGAGAPPPTPTPSAEEWVLLANDTGSNVTAFKATASSPVHTPVPQLGQSVNLGTMALGEIHFANGKAFIAIGSGLTGPSPASLPSGGLAVYDIDTQQVETIVTLVSAQTGRPSRPVHVYLDPEAKYLWVNNDGTTADPDSVFRVNVDPSDPNYLKYTEIVVGNGHHKSAFSRPNANRPNAKRLFFTSDLSERRIDLIDDDPASPTYGQVIKIVRNVGASPHGMDYSPNSGRAFTGITGGGVVSIDATQLDLNNDGVIDIPDFDCGATPDCSGDPSVVKITAGSAENPTLFAGYVHVVTNDHGDDIVYTSGFDAGKDEGYLTAIDPVNLTVIKTIVLPGVSASSFDAVGHHKIYVPARGNGSVKNVIKVVDVDHDSATFHTVIREITVGEGGSHRNGEVSPDGRLAFYPDTCADCKTVRLIDTETDTVIDTMTLPGPAANVGIVHLPFDAEDNH